MKLKRTLLLLCLIVSTCLVQATDFPITRYGAKADTTHLSTKAIQKAIDACHSAGGGRVVVPAGAFKTGSIFLRSNVYLYLEPGAILYGSRHGYDYIPVQPKYVAYKTGRPTIQLIYAESIENSGICGEGIIDGQGQFFVKDEGFKGDGLITDGEDDGIVGGRPHLIRFVTCQHITVRDVTLKSSPCWLQHYLACDDVHITGLRIFNRATKNNDAVDIDGCRNVVVSDLLCDTDDDGITLKSTSPRVTENVAITNCIVSSHCNAIKFGTETNGGFRNITVSNCIIKPSHVDEPKTMYGVDGGLAGLALEIMDGGIMENVTISNIAVSGTRSPIFIRLGNRARSYSKSVKIEHVGTLRDIQISNVTAKGASSLGCSISGIPGHYVENILLRDISIATTGDLEGKKVVQKPEELETSYPECTMFTGWNNGDGVLPARGFYVRHARNIRFENVTVRSEKSDNRPDIMMEDVVTE